MNGNGKQRNGLEWATKTLYAGINLLTAVLAVAGALAVSAFTAGALYAFVKFFCLAGYRLLTP